MTVTAGQRVALARFSAVVPVAVPWLAIGEITAACAAVAVAASVLATGRVPRSRVVDLAGLRE